AADEAQTARHASARYAADLMTTDVVRARPDDPLAQVIGAMVEGKHKLVAVVDEEGRLLGGVDRADVLRGILEEAR
ncbi:MAG TPA: CBS domain-containing protein, partial [Polyangiaceae bacterium]|nr:CBS domain-containing protein [Polyangiaceae bacterium]